MVFKASEEVPACALAIVRIAHEAGLPGDVLSVVIGDAEHVSMRLLDSQVIRCVTFTGSTRVGKILSVRAVEQMKRPVMELGGHAPVLVFDDVDPRTVARAAAAAKFRNSGQICIAPTRFFVQRRIYEDFVGALGEAADRLVPGCGFDPETTMGPLVHPRRVEAIADLVQDARSRGHRIVAGGNALDRPGSFHAPTVVADVTTETRAANIEPFGPLALVAPFDTYDEAIHLANRLPMALAAYVQTKNVHTALRAIDDIEAGSVIANGWRVSLPETPFGGHKDSGFGQEGGIEGLQAFLNIKFGYLR